MHTLNAKNLMCPMPVIRTQDTIKTMHPGEQLRVECSDPGTLHDIPAWCRINGHKLVSAQDNGDEIVIIVEVGAA